MNEMYLLRKKIEENKFILCVTETWSLFDIASDDEVTEIVVENPFYNPVILNPEFELLVLKYDIVNGIIELWDDENAECYEIKGEISINKRWFNKDELLNYIKREKNQTEYNDNYQRKMANALNETTSFVEEALRRSEIKLDAGKKVDTVSLLRQILKFLELKDTF